VNVYVSALLAPAGSPARVLELWADGRFDAIVSPLLLIELQRVLRRPKFRPLISAVEVDGLLSALVEEGIEFSDPAVQPGVTRDPGDDYLVALARVSKADLIVSGDTHLTELIEPVTPVLTPREFLDTI
jgi:uncharacterized protein